MFTLLTLALLGVAERGVPDAVLDTVGPLVERCRVTSFALDLYYGWLVGDEGNSEVIHDWQKTYFTEPADLPTPERVHGGIK